MKLFQSRVEQLADHLRKCIARGELSSPLPSIRVWSARLGVAHGTLEKALKILKNSGLVRVQPRKGIHLAKSATVRKNLDQPQLVRWLAYGRKYRDLSTSTEIFTAIEQRLTPQGIRFSIEMCSASRLQAIQREGARPDQVLLLPSFSVELQKLFAGFQKSAILLGQPFPGINLPYVSVDVHGAVRHATWMLARRGFLRISLAISENSNQPIENEFRRICAEPSPPIQGDVFRLPEDLYQQNLAVRRLVARVNGRHAFIANSPIPSGLLMMALMKRGVDVPGQAEVVAMNATTSEVRTFPLNTYYPYPFDRFSKVLCQAVIRYFEHGSLPPLKLFIPLRMVLAPT